MSVAAKSLITKLLIEKWSGDGRIALGVPYRQMASDAAETVNEVLTMLEEALYTRIEGSPTAEPDWWPLFEEWKKEKGIFHDY